MGAEQGDIRILAKIGISPFSAPWSRNFWILLPMAIVRDPGTAYQALMRAWRCVENAPKIAFALPDSTAKAEQCHQQ
jgi:hypothetical protein